MYRIVWLSVLFAVGLTWSSEDGSSEFPWPGYGGPTGDFAISSSRAVPATFQSIKPWRHSFGWGSSGIVADQARLYTAFSEQTTKTTAVEVLVALDPATGNEIWRSSYPVKFRGKQQTFNEPIQPLATPLLVRDVIVMVSFDGVVRYHARETGKVIWQVDLVEQHGATPVQYGFAGSPVALDDKTILVPAGGTKIGLIALSLNDGSTVWTSPAEEPGYATPVITHLVGTKQIIFAGRDTVYGLDPSNGQALWSWHLPSGGLTNVPTPISVGSDRLLVSGQGCDGTRCLRLSKDGGAFKVNEVWRLTSAKFFYCNWLLINQNSSTPKDKRDRKQVSDARPIVVGFDARFLVGLDPETGKLLWKLRDQTDANVIKLDDQLLALRGDGLLSLGTINATGFVSSRRAQTLSEGHCWTPPTVIGSIAFVRNGKQLAAIDLTTLTDKPAPQPPLDSVFDAAMSKWTGKERPKVISELRDVYVKQGPSAAINSFKQLTATRPDSMSQTIIEQLLSPDLSMNDPLFVLTVAEFGLKLNPETPMFTDRKLAGLRGLKRTTEADEWERNQLVSVTFRITAPNNSKPTLYLTGNCQALGMWEPNVSAVEQRAGKYQVTLQVPKGRLEYKVTQGSWDNAETNGAGKDRENRTLEVKAATTVDITVFGWKTPSSP